MMAERKDNEIMAEYLLKGGKMLEKTCPVCGCPMFEYKKKTFCVVCAERKHEAAVPSKPAAGPAISLAPTSAPSAEVAPLCQPRRAIPEAEILASEIAATIRVLCQRIKTENDPDRCLALMDAVKIGTEALEITGRL